MQAVLINYFETYKPVDIRNGAETLQVGETVQIHSKNWKQDGGVRVITRMTAEMCGNNLHIDVHLAKDE